MKEKKTKDKNLIDDRIGIAADSSKVLVDYLDAVAFEFASAGIKDAYSIVAELENTILQNLKALGKQTKLVTIDVRRQIEAIGSPHKILQDYLEINEIEIEESSRLLSVASKSRNLASGKRGLKAGLIQIVEWIFLLLPPFYIAFSFVFYGSAYDYATMLYWGTIIFIIGEITSGIAGKPLENAKIEIISRKIVKNLVFLHLVLTFTVAAVASMDFLLFRDLSPSYLNMFYYTVGSLILVEGVIFIRDHNVALSPLEPDLKPIGQIVTPAHFLISFFVAGTFFVLAADLDYLSSFIIWTWVFSIGMLFAIALGTNARFNLSFRVITLSYIPSFILALPTFFDLQRISVEYSEFHIITTPAWVLVVSLYFVQRYKVPLKKYLSEIEVQRD